MESFSKLVYYAAIAERANILADYHDAKAPDLGVMTARCLEHVPPLHDRFSFTTCNRMFICLIEGLYVYCAIVDEALSKAKAFMFLEHVRDSFKVLIQQREPLSPRTIHDDMCPFFHHLASSLVGMPQKEKLRLRWLQAQRDGEAQYGMSSPSVVAPYDEDYDPQTGEKLKSGCSRSPQSFIGKGKRGKKKLQIHEKGVINSSLDQSREAPNREGGLGITVDDISFGVHGHHPNPRLWQSARTNWWRIVKVVLLLDFVVCLLLLIVWLSVCKGIQCLK